MADIYVAASRNLGEWAAEVGLTKHIYKVGIAEDTAEAAVETLVDSAHAGETDWKLVRKQNADALDETAVIARLSKKEKIVDPMFYPRIKGAQGIFKVKPTNVENHMLIQRALANEETKAVKVKPTDVADYLIENALK
jgi:hypothetical protein